LLLALFSIGLRTPRDLRTFLGEIIEQTHFGITELEERLEWGCV
jgi:hypothetical protein